MRKIKTLPKSFSLRDKIVFLTLFLLILTFGVLFGRNFYVTNTHLVAAPGGHYNEGVIGQPNLINPLFSAMNSADRDLETLLFSRLFKYNEHQELEQDLVDSYELSEDKKEYVIKIRPDVTWHDGEKLTADDIVFTIHRILDPKTKSPLNPSLRGVTVEKIDNYSIKLILKEPYAPFLSNLTFGILPAHVWETVVPSNINLADFNLEPTGSGAWKFDKLKKDKKGNIISFTIKPNLEYYGKSPFLEKVTFKFFQDSEKLLEAFTNQQVQGIGNLSIENFEAVKDNPDNSIFLINDTQTFTLFFNPRNNIFLEDKKVRQAVEYAINKNEIIESARDGYGKVVEVPVFFGMAPADVEARSYDPDKSRQLMKEAGFTENEGKLEKSGKEMSISIVTTDWPESMIVVDIIKKNLEAVGISVNLEIIPTKDSDTFLYGVVKPRDFEALFFGETLGYEPDPYILWHSSQIQDPGLNISLFNNKQADKLLEDAREESDVAKRQNIYQDFQKILHQETPATFLYNPQFIYVVNKNVSGVNVEKIVFYSDRLSGISNWYMKTKREWKQ